MVYTDKFIDNRNNEEDNESDNESDNEEDNELDNEEGSYEESEEYIEYSEDYEIDVNLDKVVGEKPVEVESEDYTKLYSGQGTHMGSKRLMEELKVLKPGHTKKFGYNISIINDNLYNWQIELFDFPKDSKLYNDLAEYKKRTDIDHIMLNATFPAEYPYKPPFIRVIYPRFKFMTGHITIGGSICMEVLTLSGWSPGYSIENLIMQIKSEIVDPSGEARIDLTRKDHYNIAEAKESFDRLCAKYGWK